MSEPARSVARMHCLEGLDYLEIATRLGCTAGAVRALYSRARAQLARILTSRSSTKTPMT